ncbi:hypothetical protein BDN72DRAFT_876262 [Pluteus cervinus]|uniref:Uncharacterized protein n=1 Tax=Pluteus cervinus TaxID=181527 RepID=A0ACD3B4Z4_9AGAR|nr:hypothetical protein BDN72DRAFT_876262 [Pluteus cervinus]
MLQQFEAKKLLSLPTELLTEVMINLSWLSVLHARRTCRRLQDVSKSSVVWRHLVRQESRYLLRLEQPVESYSSDELEYILLRRKNAEVRYERAANGSGLELRQRTLPVSTLSYLDCVRLVPGGRWLLISTRHGSVKYYDLSTQDHIGRILIPRRYIKSKSWMSIDVDMNSPTLQFNLALINLDLKVHWDGRSNSQSQIEIWGISLVVDESGRGIGLSAGHEARSSFLQEPKGEINFNTTSLVGDYLSYGISEQSVWAEFLCLVKWKDICGPNYPKRIITYTNTSVLLNGYVCVVDGASISLVSLSGLTEFTSFSPSSPIPTLYTPIRTIRLPKGIDWVSNRTIYEDSQHFMAHIQRDIFEIVVSDSDARLGPRIDAISVRGLPHHSHIAHNFISLSDKFYLAWLLRGGMLLQRSPGLKSLPGHQALLPQLESLHFYCTLNVLDMASGQIITQQRSHIMISTFHGMG